MGKLYMPNPSELARQEEGYPIKHGFYITKFKDGSNRRGEFPCHVIVGIPFGVKIIGDEYPYELNSFEYFRPLYLNEKELWEESVKECCHYSEYKAGAVAVKEMVEKLRRYIDES